MTFGRTAQKPGIPKPRVKDPKSRTAPLGRDDSWSSRFLAPCFILIFDSATQLLPVRSFSGRFERFSPKPIVD